LIIARDLASYLVKYGYIKAPLPGAGDLPNLEERALSGDLEALLVLQMYYENPENPAYDPEKNGPKVVA